jgi:hypothetical protein
MSIDTIVVVVKVLVKLFFSYLLFLCTSRSAFYIDFFLSILSKSSDVAS